MYRPNLKTEKVYVAHDVKYQNYLKQHAINRPYVRNKQSSRTIVYILILDLGHTMPQNERIVPLIHSISGIQYTEMKDRSVDLHDHIYHQVILSTVNYPFHQNSPQNHLLICFLIVSCLPSIILSLLFCILIWLLFSVMGRGF